MSATHGLASKSRLIVCSLAVVFALSALFASTASAKGGAPIKENYLALGDSLAFGYSQQLFNENEKTGENPAAFEHGYANYYFIKKKPKVNGVALQNLGCPGETSGGLIGEGPVGKGLVGFGATIGPSCAYHNLGGLPLHQEYGGGSQLEAALGTIAKDALETKHPVTTVSVNIGANDELAAVKKCEAEAVPAEEKAYIEVLLKGGTTAEAEAAAKKAGTESVEACLKAAATGLFKEIATNVGLILFTLREGEKFGGINYTGKIIFLNSYDPYGNVFGTGELLNGSTALASILNEVIKVKVAPATLTCVAEPFKRFNPLNKTEPTKLQTLTNMANFTKFEGKNNGPDIHPTVAGYKILAATMGSNCGL